MAKHLGVEQIAELVAYDRIEVYVAGMVTDREGNTHVAEMGEIADCYDVFVQAWPPSDEGDFDIVELAEGLTDWNAALDLAEEAAEYADPPEYEVI